MKKISLITAMLLCLSQFTFAESPIIIDKRSFNTFSLWSGSNLAAWFKNNAYVNQNGYVEGRCETARPPYRKAAITNSAYAEDGAYGVAVDDGSNGFFRIISAEVEWLRPNILHAQIEDGRTVTCIK